MRQMSGEDEKACLMCEHYRSLVRLERASGAITEKALFDLGIEVVSAKCLCITLGLLMILSLILRLSV